MKPRLEIADDASNTSEADSSNDVELKIKDGEGRFQSRVT